MAYNSKYTGAEVEALLEKVDGEGAIPTKTSELENDSGFITSAALAGYATTDALDGKEDKLDFYSESGGAATIDASDANIVLNASKEITITGNAGITLATGRWAKISINSDFIVEGIVSLNQSGDATVTYRGVEIATVNDVAAATANIATPADGVNATKNAVLLLTSDDLVAEREKWFNEGANGYPSAFEVMDYSATTNSVRLRCYCTAASDVMLELDCGGKVLGYYPSFNESDGGVVSLFYWYAFDILVPYVDGAFTALQHKYTVVVDGGGIPL